MRLTDKCHSWIRRAFQQNLWGRSPQNNKNAQWGLLRPRRRSSTHQWPHLLLRFVLPGVRERFVLKWVFI